MKQEKGQDKLLNIGQNIRQEIASLKPYEAHVVEGNIKLDANENPFPWPEGMKEELFSKEFAFNRYPDSTARALRDELARYNGSRTEEVLLGNGSDELIQTVLHTFGGRGRSLMIHPPTFGMYGAAATITGTTLVEVPLVEGTKLDLNTMLEKCSTDESIKVIIICNPNNPTGALFPKEEILDLVRHTKALVVVDEAYVEFAGESLIEQITNYPNLLIMRTFSKAFGMAALRLGYVLGNEELINSLNKVRQPFNVNSFSQRAGMVALKYASEYMKQIEIIKKEVQVLYNELNKIPNLRVLPTKANFILIQPEEPNVWADELSSKGFTIRNLGDLPGLGQSLRISAGTPEENKAFLQAVKEVANSDN